MNGLVVGAITITRQTVYGGFIDGLSIGLLALGVVLIYRSSRVINFAVGAIGALSAALLALLVLQYDWSFWPAAIVSIAAGGAFAAAIELTVVRRLFTAPRVTRPGEHRIPATEQYVPGRRNDPP